MWVPKPEVAGTCCVDETRMPSHAQGPAGLGSQVPKGSVTDPYRAAPPWDTCARQRSGGAFCTIYLVVLKSAPPGMDQHVQLMERFNELLLLEEGPGRPRTG